MFCFLRFEWSIEMMNCYDDISLQSVSVNETWRVDHSRGIASQLRNDDFCSHGHSVLFFFLHTSAEHFCQRFYGSFETIFERHTPTNSTRVSQGTNSRYVRTSEHTNAKYHGSHTFLTSCCVWNFFVKFRYVTNVIEMNSNLPILM